MARLPRFDAPGAIHHVWACGPGPSAIFRADDDRLQDDADLLGVVRYIALNPLDIAGVEHPLDWRWASYRTLAAGTA